MRIKRLNIYVLNVRDIDVSNSFKRIKKETKTAQFAEYCIKHIIQSLKHIGLKLLGVSTSEGSTQEQEINTHIQIKMWKTNYTGKTSFDNQWNKHSKHKMIVLVKYFITRP